MHKPTYTSPVKWRQPSINPLWWQIDVTTSTRSFAGVLSRSLRSTLCFFFKFVSRNNSYLYILTKVRSLLEHSCAILLPFKIVVIFNTTSAKGQLVSKANCQAVNSSKKRTNEFVLLLCNVFSFVFWKKLKSPKRHFEIIWPLNQNKVSWCYIENDHNFERNEDRATVF